MNIIGTHASHVHWVGDKLRFLILVPWLSANTYILLSFSGFSWSLGFLALAPVCCCRAQLLEGADGGLERAERVVHMEKSVVSLKLIWEGEKAREGRAWKPWAIEDVPLATSRPTKTCSGWEGVGNGPVQEHPREGRGFHFLIIVEPAGSERLPARHRLLVVWRGLGPVW